MNRNCLGLSNHTYFQEEKKSLQADLFFKKRTAEVNKLERKPGEMFWLISCHDGEGKWVGASILQRLKDVEHG